MIGSNAGRLCSMVILAMLSMVAPWSAAQGAKEIFDARAESAEAGFADLDLGIDSMACDDWKACTLHASGLFQGKRVALDVAIRMGSGQVGKITYRSVGAESDALLTAMSTLYKRPLQRQAFSKTATADVVFLGAESEKLDAKVFFSPDGPEADYAELYTNIDRKRSVLEIHEKDTGYRTNVLKALSR